MKHFILFLMLFLIILAVIILILRKWADSTKHELVLQYPNYQIMKAESDVLFQKGWSIKDYEMSNITYEYVVIYEK